MKKFLSYILTFALMFFISAAATVSMAYFGSNGNLLKPNTSVDGSVGNTSLFNGILETFQKKKQFNIKGNLELESEDVTIPVTIYVNADINDMENMKFEGFILYQKDQVSFAISFSFINNIIYLTHNNSNIKIEVNSIFDFIDYITALLPSNEESEDITTENNNSNQNSSSSNNPVINTPIVNTPSTELNPPKEENQEEGADFLEELMPVLMDALNNMKETSLENEDKQIELSIPDLADVKLVVNKDNQPKKVDLSTANFKGYKLNASLELEFNEYIEIVSPEEVEPVKEYFNLKELATIVQNINSLKNFSSNVNFKLNNNIINFDLLANTDNNNYKFVLNNNQFGFVNDLNLAYVDKDLYVNFNNVNVLINNKLMKDLPNVSFDKEILRSLLPEVKESLQTFELIETLSSKIQINNVKDVLALISIFEGFEITDEHITISVNTNLLGLNLGKIKLDLRYNSETINQISIKGLEIRNSDIDLTLNIEPLKQEIEVENKEKYIDIYSFYKNNVDFFKSGKLDFATSLVLFDEGKTNFSFASSVKFDINSDYLALDFKTKINNKNINVEVDYVNDWAFVKLNNIKVKMSKAQAKELIYSLNLNQTPNIDINPIFEDLTNKLTGVNPLDLLKVLFAVKDIKVDSGLVYLDVNLKDLGYDLDFVVTVVLENNIVSKLYVNLNETNNKLTFNLDINSNNIVKDQVNENEYLEITKFVEGLNELLSLTEADIKLNIDALINNQNYYLDLFVKASLDEEYAKVNLDLNGNKNLDFNLSYYNKTAFVNLNNMFVKFESENLITLLGLILKTSNISSEDAENAVNSLGIIDKVSSIIDELNIDKLAYIKNITINSSLIEVIIDKELFNLNGDLVIALNLTESNFKSIESTIVVDNQNKVSFKLDLVNTEVTKEEIDEDKYLSIEKTLANLEKLLYTNILNVSLDIDVLSSALEKELGFSLDFSKLYENGKLNLNAIINLILGENTFGLDLIHNNGISYVEYNGLKVLIETDRIIESIERVLGLVNINIEDYENILSKFVGLLEGKGITSLFEGIKFDNIEIDYNKLTKVNINSILPVMILMANELKIDANQISFVVSKDKLGINTDINLVITLTNGGISNIKLTKLNIFDKFVDINIDVDTIKKDLSDVEEEEKDKYINIAEITEIIESFKSTFKNLTLSGDVTVNLKVNNKPINVTVDYGVKYVNNALTVYLKTTILGVDINLYFINNTIYADIQGMKINVKLNEIDDLFKFIQSEFGLKIESQNNIEIPEIKPIDIIGLISTVDLDKISEIIYGENTIEVTFVNGLNIFVNYNNIINKIKVAYRDIMVEFNVDSNSDFTLDIVESDFESYEEIIDLYNSALNTFNNLRNIDATLTLDILKDKIANQISVNVLANILENNYKVSLLSNSYGYVNNLSLAYLNNDFYAYVNNYSVLLSEELINIFKGLIFENVTKEDINKLIDFAKEQKEKIDYKVVLGSLKYIEEISLTKSSITIKILKSAFDMGEGTIDITLTHNNNFITGLNIENIIVFGYKLDLDIDLTETEDKVDVLVPETYLNIYDVVNKNIDYFNDLALDFDLIVKSSKDQKELFNSNIKYDIYNSYVGIDAYVGYKNGHKIQVEFNGNEAYLKIDNVKVKISTEQAFEIISKLDLNKAQEATTEIKNEVLSVLRKLTPQDIIKIIASISIDKVSSEGVIVSIKGAALNLNENVIINLTIVNNVIKSITIKEIVKDNNEYDVTLNINSNVVTPNDINEEEYVDVVNLIENTIDLFKSTSGEIDLDIDALIKGVQYILDLDFEGDLNNKYFDLTAELKEGYSIFTNLTLIDGVLYVNINDAYVSVNIETILGLILGNIDVEFMKQELSTIEKDELINELMNLVKSFDISLITKIKSVVVNSSYIEVVVDKSVLGGTQDLVVKIDLLNNVPYIVNLTNLYVNSDIQINSLVLNFVERTVEVKELDEEKYLNVETIIENNIEYFNDLSLDLDILISKVQDNSTLLDANIKYDISNNYYGIDVFIGYNSGHKIQVEFNGNEAYLLIDNVKVKITTEQAFNIISKFDLAQAKTEAGNVVNNIVDVVLAKLSETSTQDLLRMAASINYITANSNGLVVSVNGSVFGFENNVMVELTLIDGVVRNILVTGIEAFDTQVNFNVQINSNVVTPNDINEEEYVDVVNLIENTIDLFKSTSGEIDLDIDALIKGVQYILDLEFEGNLNNGYFDLIAELKEGYSIFTNLTMIDGVLYANINDMFIKVDIETIMGLILGNVDIESMKQEIPTIEKNELINELMNLVKSFDISLITKIKSVVVNSSYIEVVVDKSVLGGTQDLIVRIDLLNNVPYIVNLTNLYVNSDIQINSLVLNFVERTVEVKELDEEKYLNIEQTIENAQELLALEDLNAIINVDLFDSELIHKLGLSVDYKKHLEEGNLSLSALIKLISGGSELILDTRYLNETFFANFNGLNVMLEKDRIVETIQTILSVVGLKENMLDDILVRIIKFLETGYISSALEGLDSNNNQSESKESSNDFDIKEIVDELINNIQITSTQIIIDINGSVFGYNSNIYVVISLNNGYISNISVQKLKVEDKFIDINISLDRSVQNIEKLEINKQPEVRTFGFAARIIENLGLNNDYISEFINLAELTKVIESGYNTIKDGLLTGNFTIKVGGIDLNINYGIKLANGKVDAYVATNYQGIDAKLQFTNKTFFIEVQGMKVHADLEHIKELIGWVKTEFGVEINEDLFDEIKNEATNAVPSTIKEVIDLVNSIDFSVLDKVVFNENTMKIILLNGENLFVGYGETIEQVKVNVEGIKVEVNVNNAPSFEQDFEIEVKEDEYTSYTALTDLYEMLKETISLDKNFDLTFDINIDENNIKFNTLFDVNNKNLLVQLLNNTYGYVENSNIVFIDGEAYINVNNIYVKLSEKLFNDAPELANKLIDSLGLRVNINNLKAELEQSLAEAEKIDFTQYLKFINNLSINKNSFVAKINANILSLGDYLIDVVITHKDGVITSIKLINLNIEGTEIDANISIDKTNKAVSVESAEKYIDIYETILENIEFFNNKALDLDVNFDINGKLNVSAIGNIKLDLNKKYFAINLNINGDYEFNISLEYINNTAYLSVNNIKVQTTLDKVQSLLKEFGINIDIQKEISNLINDLSSSTNSLDNISFDDIWNSLNKLELTNEKFAIDFLLDIFNINSNLDVNILFNNLLIKELILTNFNYEGLTINANININSNNVIENIINVDKYLDIEQTVLNAKDLIYKDIINLLAQIKIYDSELNYKFGLDLDLSKLYKNEYLLGNMFINLLYNNKEFNIKTIYEDNTLFANINGLKLFLEKDRILESIQTVLGIINVNVNSYDELIINIISLLEGTDIISVINDLGVKVSTPSINLDYSELIKTLISGVVVNNNQIIIKINGSVFGYNETIDAIINLENNKIKSVVVSKLKLGDYYFDINLSLNETEKVLDKVNEEDKESYINIAEFIDVIKSTYNTLINKQLSGTITLSFNFAGETNLLNVNYGVKYDDANNYIAYVQTNFKGLDVNIYYINGVIYLDIVGMKIQLTFTDINNFIEWLGKFGVTLNFDATEIEEILKGNINLNISVKEILDLMFNLDLNFINKVLFNENTLEAYIKNEMSLFVNYTDVVNQVIFRYKDIFVELNCTQFDNVVFDNIDKTKYVTFDVVTNTIDSVLETIENKQFNLVANAKIYENESLLNNLDINLALDLVNTINAYLSFVVDGNTSTDINAAYQNDYLYVNYDNLKLSINQKNFRELLVIALEALGVDSTAISFLADVADEMDVSAENLNSIMPNLDFGNPLNLLKVIKHIDIVDGNFMIVLDGTFITNDENANDMTLNIYSDEEGIKAIELLNIYAGSGSKQHFDLRIDLKEFNGVKQITDTETYIDISGSANLLESFVNTSNLNDYTITGTIQVVANIIGINIDMDIPVTVKVKIVEGGKVEAYAVLDIPVIGSNVPGFTGINVNNDVPYDTGDTSVESRKLELMIKDNYVYMHRTDVVNQTIFADRIYEKALKVSTQEFSWNLTYYLLQYGIGMSDAIMGEIEKAFDKAVHREDNPLDISNVLNGYTHEDGSNKHTISINLAEIANNELLGNANIDIYTVNNETTGNKDYIGTLGFVIDMPLASVCTINLETNNLSLINIGQTVDLSNMYSYVNSYSYKENQQWEYTDGNNKGWVMADEVEYTINFSDPMGNNVNSITTTVKSPITLPNLSTIVKNEADGQHTYTFAGWFIDEGLTKEFTETVMPRGNRTLYAKWNESVKYNRTVTLNSMGANQDSKITQLEGSVLVLPNLSNYEVMEGQTKIVYGFAGWFLDESCSTKFTSAYMPNVNTTLYAKWVEVERFTAYNMIVYDNGKVVFDKFIQEGTSISFSGFKLDSNTKFYSDYALTNEVSKPTIMPSNNLVVHIKNMYTLTIISSYGTVVNSTSSLYQGSSFSLPTQKTYVVDNGTTRTTYTFNGYNNSSNIMPNSDLTVTAQWTVDVKHYYTVTFKLCYNGNAAFYKYAKLYKNGVELGSNEISVKVLEGSLDLTEYTAVWEYKVIWKYWYNFQGFSTSKNGSAMSTVQITGNTTIYGLWSGLKS